MTVYLPVLEATIELSLCKCQILKSNSVCRQKGLVCTAMCGFIDAKMN